MFLSAPDPHAELLCRCLLCGKRVQAPCYSYQGSQELTQELKRVWRHNIESYCGGTYSLDFGTCDVQSSHWLTCMHTNQRSVVPAEHHSAQYLHLNCELLTFTSACIHSCLAHRAI